MYKLPYPEPMSELQILDKARQFYLEYIREVGQEHVIKYGIDFDEVYDSVIYPRYEIILVKDEDLGVDDFGNLILGRYIAKEKVALVTNLLFKSRDPRTVFTQWHEVGGHGVLQGEFLRKTQSKNQKLYTTEEGIVQLGIENTFEWQANTFAANIAAPKNYVYFNYAKLFGMRRKIKYMGAGRYSLIFNDMYWPTYVGSPLNLAWKIAKKIRYYFWGLSIESLAYQVLDVAIDMNGYNRGEFWPERKENLNGGLDK